jgi:15-cis-phytoene synthase
MEPDHWSLSLGKEAATHLHEARAVARRSARTFSLGMRLLPNGVRADVQLLYLVARTLDDLVDGGRPDAAERLEAVERWARTGELRGREPVILEHLASRHCGLPRDAVLDLCTGLRFDLAGPHIETEHDLDWYSYCVAGTVGRLMAAVLGTRRPEADRAARALGIAMQRTNVLRDIDEDLAHGRIYIPRTTLEVTGVRDIVSDDRSKMLRVSAAMAEWWYDRGLAGVQDLKHGGLAVRASALMYRDILRQIGRDGWGSRRPWRAHVPRRRKAWLIAVALTTV